MSKSNKMSLSISDDDPAVGYLTLPGHQGTETVAVSRTICLRELLDDYKGPDVNLDFDSYGLLVGIESVG